MSNSNNMVLLEDVKFSWGRDANAIIDIPKFSVRKGEHVFLKGPSGSGKTTLLSLIAAVLTPQQGRITIDDVRLDSLRRSRRDQFRVDKIGLVFQQFNLLPFLSVAENVQLSCRFSNTRHARAIEVSGSLDDETDRLLSAMRLSPGEMRNQHTSKLSVGQQQRVAVARALIGQPPLVIADEPTSSLDSDSRQAFLELLFGEVSTTGASLLFVSHDSTLADSFDRQVDLTSINNATHHDMLVGDIP